MEMHISALKAGLVPGKEKYQDLSGDKTPNMGLNYKFNLSLTQSKALGQQCMLFPNI